MNTKEAIKFLRSHFEIGIYTKKSDEIIELLQQGENDRIELADENQMLKNYIKDLVDGSEIKRLKKENVELKKYKQMWKINMEVAIKDSKEGAILHPTRILLDLEKLEQKYFPKEAKTKNET